MGKLAKRNAGRGQISIMQEIVVISGKGGTGKTSLVSGLAATGTRQVLGDCDVDASDLHLIMAPEILEAHEFINGQQAQIVPDLCTGCGLCRAYCRFQAISEDYRVMQEHCEGCALCLHVCPESAVSMHDRHCGQWFSSSTRFGPMIHASLGIGQENSGKLVSIVRKKSHQTAQEEAAENVLGDGAPGVGCPVIASLTNADMALLVTEPTRSAFADLRRVFDLTRHFKIPCLAVINKADLNPDITVEIERFCLEYGLGVPVKLPYDQDFTRAQIQGQSIVEYHPEKWTRPMQDIWKSAAKILKHKNNPGRNKNE